MSPDDPVMSVGQKRPPARLARAVRLALVSALASGVLPVRAELPVPCGGACGAAGGPAFFYNPAAAVTPVTVTQPTDVTMTITQHVDRAVLNWQTFNIGRDNAVVFQQPANSSVAVNKIWDASGDPSRILGSLSANGQIYIINRNGVVFGEGAQVNVQSLVASSLDAADDLLEQGVFAPLRDGRPAFTLRPRLDGDGNIVPGGPIQVEDGALLEAGRNGRIMLLAPEVENRGTLRAPDGQVILGAGERVWIADGTDSYLRGFIVEVDAGGVVRNLGDIAVDRGNVSLVGLAVNQSGRVSASTSVSLGGSVRLVARDTVRVEGTTLTPERSGAVEFGVSSITEILPDFASTDTAIDEQEQPASIVTVVAKTIDVGESARVTATGGIIDFVATADPAAPLIGVTAGNGATIDIAEGAVLDVSGTRDVSLPMERNVVTVELRGNELKDSPLQRDGILYGREIRVDIREGTPIADISGALANIQRGIGERTTAGGTIALRSEDTLRLAEGAMLDVSGGSVRYESGSVDTTRLISGGRVYDISEADPDRRYDGILGGYQRASDKWGVKNTYQQFSGTVEPGYVEGRDAGSMTLLGNRMELAGMLRGETIAGAWQRELPGAVTLPWTRPAHQLPLGGAAIFGDAGQLSAPAGTANFRMPGVVFRSPDESTEDLSEGTLVLDPALFKPGGISRLAIYSNERIVLPEDERIALAPGGSLTLVAGSAPAGEDGGEIVPALAIDGDVGIASGAITLRTVQTALMPQTQLDARHRIGIGENATLDVSGVWVNDSPLVAPALPDDTIAIAGGTIGISSAGGVDIAEGAALLLNGGAWLSRDGGLTAGAGGHLNIGSSLASVPTLRLDGRFESYSLVRGGTLSVNAAGIAIADTDAPGIADDGLWTIDPSFFQQGGFSGYALGATHLGLIVAENTLIAPRALNWIMRPGMSTAASGTPFTSLARTELLPDYLRAPVDLSLSSLRSSDFAVADASLAIAAGAIVDADINASVSLSSDRILVVDGMVSAPGGDITLSLAGGSRPNEGMLADKAIWLGPEAVLAAPAAVSIAPDPLGRRGGAVFSGGTVTLRAQRGFVVTDPGSLIDVSGTATVFDIVRAGGVAYEPTTIAGAAGTVRIEAPEGVILAGSVRAHAADAPGAAGGTLAVTLGASGDPLPDQETGTLKRPTGVRELALLNGDPAALLAGTRPGDALYSAAELTALRGLNNGVESRAVISLSRLQEAGLDDVDFAVKPVVRSGNVVNGARIRLDEDAELSVRGRVTLDAPVIAGSGGNALIEAGYLAMGPTDTTLQTRIVATPSAGGGTFTARAGLIDLTGDLSIQGFGTEAEAAAVLESTGDVRLTGRRIPVGTSPASTGSLRTAADLRIEAAQIYPTTLSEFTLEAMGEDRMVSLSSPGGDAPAIPLSAGGILNVRAARIEVLGTVRAPHGRVTLEAESRLTLADGAEVSVAGPATPVPYGQTQFGVDWVLPYAATLLRVVGGPEGEVWSVPLPEKVVELAADDVVLDAGARVVLDGGGDLHAWEFIPGPGGSSDVLLAQNAPGAFAIIPTAAMSSAPLDPFIPTTGLAVGDTIEIGRGIPGLPAGTYALLPARYALLPGAFLLTPARGMAGLAPTDAFATLGELPIVAARHGSGTTGVHDSLWSGYIVENGEQLRQRAEYRESLASEFFAGSAQRMPADAGRLAIDAGVSLALGAAVQASAPGRGGLVDIVADRLAVVGEVTGQESRVELLAESLQQLHVDSLLLGGRREQDREGIRIEAESRQVSVEAGVDLTLPEIILVAAGGEPGDEERGVRVASGATLRGVGARTDTPSRYLIAGDAAMLRVSSGDAAEVERSALPAQTHARLVLEEGSTLSAGVLLGEDLRGGNITLDSSGDAVSAALLRLGADGALQLAASRISLGDVSAVGEVQGLSLSQSDLASLDISNLFLKSVSTIDVYGSLDLAVSGTLALDTAVLRGIADDSAPEATLSATRLVWTASGAAAAEAAPITDPAGSLILSAGSLRLGDIESAAGDAPAYAVQGFAFTRLEADDELVLQGSGALSTFGELQLAAPWLTTSDGAGWRIDAAGAVAVSAIDGAAAAPAAAGLGSRLALSGTALNVDGRMLLPAGTVALRATGEDGDIRLADGAYIDVAAVREIFMDQTVTSPGGRVELSADGDIVMEVGAGIDVSGIGGELGVRAQGVARLDGELIANAADGDDGSFTLSAQRIDDFSALNAALNAGGFGAARDIRLRGGDVAIAAGETVRARDFTLVLDGEAVEEGGAATGNFALAGTIDASGESAGQVRIHVRGDLDVTAGALIDAHAAGENRQGGDVELASAAGMLSVSDGAHVDVSGTQSFEYTRPVLDESGQVVQHVDDNGNPVFDDIFGLPVPALETVAVTDTGNVRYRVSRAALLDEASRPVLQGTVSGARRVEIEALQVYTEADGRIDAGDVAASAANPLYQEAVDLMAEETDILAALGLAEDPRVHLTPGIQIRSEGDLILAAPWDLAQWRFGEDGESGVLSLRAAGDIVLEQLLSDGAQNTVDPLFFIEKDTLLRENSWSLRLAAGADFTSVDPLAVKEGIGDVRLGAGAMLRTGTGDIKLRAGRDLVLSADTSTIYTGGIDAGQGSLDSLFASMYLNGVYPVLGGDVDIAVGRHVEAVAGAQLVNDWLWRIGGDTDVGQLPHAWNVSLTEFRQGVAAFGGGNVTVIAGGDVRNLSVSMPTTGRQTGENGFDPLTGTFTVQSDEVTVHGGETLAVKAGGDIVGGVYHLGQGAGELTARGSVARAQGINTFYPMLGLGAGEWQVTAGRDATVETVFNPTQVASALQQGSEQTLGGAGFLTYDDASALHLTALAGEARLNQSDLIQNHSFIAGRLDPQQIALYRLYPGSLYATSLRGDVVINRSLDLIAAPRGQLALFADGNVRAQAASSPVLTMQDLQDALPIHVGDDEPVRIVARRGDIGGEIINFNFPKAARLEAGGDIHNIRLDVKHLDGSDVTRLSAGGGIIHDMTRAATGALGTSTLIYEIAGPGRVEFMAGGDIDLGTANGILTTGNTRNPLLPEGGAGVTLIAGLREPPRFDEFVQTYLVEREDYAGDLAAYLQGFDTDSVLADLDNFLALPAEHRTPFLWQVLFAELRDAGVDATTLGSGDFGRGYAAIRALFPEELYEGESSTGNITLLLSRISTPAGGDITLVAPGGIANAGVATSSQLIKSPDELGIVANDGGSVNAFVRGDFMVNQSRVFAIGGGDILIWSSFGDIDAGRGAKSTISAPPPQVTTDPQTGATVVAFPPAIAGSGIRAIETTPGVTGDVYLFAPAGIVSAGDAGIGAAGNVTIGAVEVIGADNIDVGGTSVGIPLADTGGFAAGLSNVSNVSNAASKSSEEALGGGSNVTGDTPLADAAFAVLDVVVLGLGLGDKDASEREAAPEESVPASHNCSDSVNCAGGGA